MVTEKKRLRPRSLERYAETIRVKARQAFIEFTHLEAMGDKSLAYREAILRGEWDDMPMLQMAAFMVDRNAMAESAGVKCTGCGSAWTDELLADEQRKRAESGGPLLRSCCPERKIKPVFWCADAIRA